MYMYMQKSPFNDYFLTFFQNGKVEIEAVAVVGEVKD
jgi:hypothetical protein